jgi:CheY-like chemotaxis protein
MLLKLWGHDVRQTYDGTAALEVARAFRPDVLLLDIAIPGLDGCRLAQELRRQAGFEGTLLIAVTGYGDRAHRLQCEADFDHYLVKPVEPATVAGLLLGQQQRLAESSAAPRATARERGMPSGDGEQNGVGVPSLGLRRQGSVGWPVVKGQEGLDLSRAGREPSPVVPVDTGP